MKEKRRKRGGIIDRTTRGALPVIFVADETGLKTRRKGGEKGPYIPSLTRRKDAPDKKN